MKAILILAAALVSTSATGAPCDAFQEPLAYNACLARQGPAAHAVSVRAAPTAQRRVVAQRRLGRSEMVFSPGR